MASDDIECITLDDSDDDQTYHHHHQAVAGAGWTHGVPVHHLVGPPGPSLPRYGPQMIRCNLCVDPGLLPVETDRAKHR